MRAEWRAFLLDAGAEFSDDANWRIDHYGNPSRECQLVLNGTALCDLNHYGIIQVSGTDAATFLQGQLSNDITLVDYANSQLSAYCTPKGRVLTLLRIVKSKDGYLLLLPQALLPMVQKRLQMYIMMSKVEPIQIDNDFVIIGVSGPDASKELAKWVNPVVADTSSDIPDNINQSCSADDMTIIRIHSDNPRFLIIAPVTRAKTLWSDLNINAAPVGSMPWMLLDILAGIPEISIETTETQVPQMLNLDRINAISFKKGCYPGQEIVARMHYLGKLKKRMYQLHFPAGVSIETGAELLSPDARADEAVGNIISYAQHPEGHIYALAVLQRKIADNHCRVHLTGDETNVAECHIPAYGFED